MGFAIHRPAYAKLQLGHGIFAVEIQCAACSVQIQKLLQLGHGIFSVET